MDQTSITRLCDIISNYKQMEHSKLWDDIQAVLGCDQKEAADMADSHCNSVSFWAMCLVSGKINITYQEYFKFCLNTKFKSGNEMLSLIGPNGYMYAKKDYLLEQLGYPNYKVIKYADNDIFNNIDKLNPDKFYQVRVTGHFMSSYIKNNVLYLADTMRRGVDVPAKGAYKMDNKNFIYLLEI